MYPLAAETAGRLLRTVHDSQYLAAVFGALHPGKRKAGKNPGLSLPCF
jgi:hypothetical protein